MGKQTGIDFYSKTIFLCLVLGVFYLCGNNAFRTYKALKSWELLVHVELFIWCLIQITFWVVCSYLFYSAKFKTRFDSQKRIKTNNIILRLVVSCIGIYFLLWGIVEFYYAFPEKNNPSIFAEIIFPFHVHLPCLSKGDCSYWKDLNQQYIIFTSMARFLAGSILLWLTFFVLPISSQQKSEQKSMNGNQKKNRNKEIIWLVLIINAALAIVFFIIRNDSKSSFGILMYPVLILIVLILTAVAIWKLAGRVEEGKNNNIRSITQILSECGFRQGPVILSYPESLFKYYEIEETWLKEVNGVKILAWNIEITARMAIRTDFGHDAVLFLINKNIPIRKTVITSSNESLTTYLRKEWVYDLFMLKPDVMLPGKSVLSQERGILPEFFLSQPFRRVISKMSSKYVDCFLDQNGLGVLVWSYHRDDIMPALENIRELSDII